MKTLGIMEFGIFLDLDYQFHKVISQAPQNGVLIEFLNLTRLIIDEERHLTSITKKGLKKSVMVHQSNLDALALGDVKTSVRAMEDHLKWTKKQLELP